MGARTKKENTGKDMKDHERYKNEPTTESEKSRKDELRVRPRQQRFI